MVLWIAIYQPFWIADFAPGFGNIQGAIRIGAHPAYELKSGPRLKIQHSSCRHERRVSAGSATVAHETEHWCTRLP